MNPVGPWRCGICAEGKETLCMEAGLEQNRCRQTLNAWVEVQENSSCPPTLPPNSITFLRIKPSPAPSGNFQNSSATFLCISIVVLAMLGSGSYVPRPQNLMCWKLGPQCYSEVGLWECWDHKDSGLMINPFMDSYLRLLSGRKFVRWGLLEEGDLRRHALEAIFCTFSFLLRLYLSVTMFPSLYATLVCHILPTMTVCFPTRPGIPMD